MYNENDDKKNFYKYEYSEADLLSDAINPTLFYDLLNWSKNIKIYCYTIKNGQFKGVT